MVEGTLSAGGYMVPSPLSAQIIDKARNSAVCIRAGARTVPMDSSTLAIAPCNRDPTAAWRAEMAAISASDMALDRVVLTAHTLAWTLALTFR